MAASACAVFRPLSCGPCERGATDRTVVSNDCEVDGASLGLLLEQRRIRHYLVVDNPSKTCLSVCVGIKGQPSDMSKFRGPLARRGKVLVKAR